jgi:hypothetical protein
MHSGFSDCECTGELVVSGVEHFLEASGASEGAYCSVQEVAKTVQLFCFVLQSNMTVVKVTRSYATVWKYQRQETNKRRMSFAARSLTPGEEVSEWLDMGLGTVWLEIACACKKSNSGQVVSSWSFRPNDGRVHTKNISVLEENSKKNIWAN